MNISSWLRLCGSIGLLVVAAAGCTEADKQLFDEVGVVQLFLIDPAQSAQSVVNPGTLQVADWELSAPASFEIGGTVYDLLFEEDCRFVDTAARTPVAVGACQGGLVIESSEEPQEVRLTLNFRSMTVRRAKPVELVLGDDFDGDLIPNDGDLSGSSFDNPCGEGQTRDCDDNCPLVNNPGQEDVDANGIGNACTVLDFFTGLSFRDSDADLVVDGNDNCVWIPNTDQLDGTGLGAEGFPDAIGDACEEQLAQVELGGATEFTLELPPTDLIQPVGAAIFLTIDFNNGRALSCDWESEKCTLFESEVRFCTRIAGTAALFGC